MRISDWSSDVCSSDLGARQDAAAAVGDGDLGAGDLAVAALAAELADRFDQDEHAVHAGVGVGEATAVGVRGQGATGAEAPVGDEVAALALGTDAEVLQGHQPSVRASCRENGCQNV